MTQVPAWPPNCSYILQSSCRDIFDVHWYLVHRHPRGIIDTQIYYTNWVGIIKSSGTIFKFPHHCLFIILWACLCLQATNVTCSIFSFLKRLILFLIMCMCICVYVNELCAHEHSVHIGQRRVLDILVLKFAGYCELLDWVLGIEHRSLETTVLLLNWWVTSPDLLCMVFHREKSLKVCGMY